MHPFFALLSLSKGKYLKEVHPSGMDTGVLFVSEFVSWMTNSSGLNFLLLALPGLHPAAQVYKVIFNSYYKSRFMSLFVLFSMKWLCRIFPFTPLSSLYYSYSPPLSCLRNLISFSGSPCRNLAYSSHHPYSYNLLHRPLSRQSTAAKVKCSAQEAQHSPAYKVQTHPQ